MNQTHIPIDDMIENIVSGRTRRIYYDDTLHFIKWCIRNKPTLVTTYCKEQIRNIDDSVHGMRSRECNRRVKDRFKELLRNAPTVPDLRFVMTYIETNVREANRWTDDHSATSIAQKFRAVEHNFIITSSNRSHDRRDSQIKWQTMVQLLRKKESQHRQQQQQH
jgi:hypothetical protein